jgi:hypothetical protein
MDWIKFSARAGAISIDCAPVALRWGVGECNASLAVLCPLHTGPVRGEFDSQFNGNGFGVIKAHAQLLAALPALKTRVLFVEMAHECGAV